jgi:hypothetical protein
MLVETFLFADCNNVGMFVDFGDEIKFDFVQNFQPTLFEVSLYDSYVFGNGYMILQV